MRQYAQLRSSSPSDEHRETSKSQFRQHVQDESPVEDEQKERLLAQELTEDSPSGDELDNRQRQRRKWRHYGLFGLAAIIVVTAVVAVFYWFHLTKKQADVAKTFRRPSSDYVIDPAWDFAGSPAVREYDWVVSDIVANPDGVFRPMVVINGQFPGPMIVCNEGDTVVINVRNHAKNATSIHWHGLFQNGTAFMDGTVGVTQCPIAPGQSFRYEFKVKGQAGTYFYHGHQAAQGLDGLIGPFIILSQTEKDNQPIMYDTDRVVMVQDWYYDTSDGLLRQTLSPGSESSPVPNGALINGANKVDCLSHPDRKCDSSSAVLPTLDLEPDKHHRLRVINVGGFAWFEVSVDKHLDLSVTEVDGVTVEPSSDSAITIAPGQRYSIILSTDQTEPSGLYWFRARMLSHCFAENVLPEKGMATAQAVLRYNNNELRSSGSVQRVNLDTNTAVITPQTEPDSGKYTVICKDSAPGTYKPIPALAAPEYAHHSWYFRLNLEIGDWRLERGFLNKSTFRPQLASPTLHRLVDGLQDSDNNASFHLEGVNTAAFDTKHDLVVSSNTVETIDIILQNFDEGNHPFHLHGTQMFILAAGHGYFPGYEALGLQPGGRGLLSSSSGSTLASDGSITTNNSIIANPTRRDVTAVESFGWTLIRFVADNPGVWLFHCHMIWHAEAGMAMQFASRLDVLKTWSVPEQSAHLCNAPIEELEKGATPKDDIWFGHFDGKA
ncbi:multicopper oxidase-domain-containing protein [Coniella lustricola]|uniref:Multicopper oxidase-domain-containing protein n=1 Tax=Coniella lustricola TaxID=2025994 RepID=A0A2T3AH59_9PEZI|nr:multicopper oxidase-domain-containing protein [Coniella lustricola]